MKVEHIESGTFVGGEEDTFNMLGDDRSQDCYVLTLTQIKALCKVAQNHHRLGREGKDFDKYEQKILKIIE